MKRILIAYDGSPGADAAIDDLPAAGLPERAEARILTVADVWLPPVLVKGWNQLENPPSLVGPHAKAAGIFRDAKAIAVKGALLVHGVCPQWNVSNSATADSPAWGLLAEATCWQADLIVVGSHGWTPLREFFLGSVSHKVTALADCPVRIVRAAPIRGATPRRILVGLDGSPGAWHAVHEVLQRRWGAGTQFELVTVIDEKARRGVVASTGLFEDAHAADRIEEVTEGILERARAEFAAGGLLVNGHILEGDPKSRLLECAKEWDVSCLFLGACGNDHPERRQLGTLASAICTRAHCTVEIVRPPRSAAGSSCACTERIAEKGTTQHELAV